MEIKEIKPMNVLYFSTQTTIMELDKYVRVIAKQLYQEASRLELEITGCVYWVYYGMDGKPETVFTLEVALPVQEAKGTPNQFNFKQLSNFKCASLTHYGAWEKMPESYQKLIGEIFANGLQMSEESRELYINMDFNHPASNIAEIQLGIL